MNVEGTLTKKVDFISFLIVSIIYNLCFQNYAFSAHTEKDIAILNRHREDLRIKQEREQREKAERAKIKKRSPLSSLNTKWKSAGDKVEADGLKSDGHSFHGLSKLYKGAGYEHASKDLARRALNKFKDAKAIKDNVDRREEDYHQSRMEHYQRSDNTKKVQYHQTKMNQAIQNREGRQERFDETTRPIRAIINPDNPVHDPVPVYEPNPPSYDAGGSNQGAPPAYKK